jgi:RimJ/RimL family protein N-acetyltransferase
LLELVQPSSDDIKELYKWKIEEIHHELYSCRPVNPIGSFEDFYTKTINRLEDKDRIHRILVDRTSNEILGEIKGFDYNPRNHSLEFGYYLPIKNRRKGFGEIMIRSFIDAVFSDKAYELNKLYATTSGNNEASKGVLAKIGFKLDGKNREHYWVDNNRYDQFIYSLLKKEWEEIAPGKDK